MVKLLPIPSLKKVRITKTKIQQRNRPKTVPVPVLAPEESPYNPQDMMLQNAHGPVLFATFARKTPKGDR
jgi:hypothetical protein